MSAADWLPEMVTFNQFGGDWDGYLDALHGFFHADFVADKFQYDGKRVGLKKHPIECGKEATFWHMIQCGDIEAERTPDLRRCERIRWPKAIITNAADPSVLVWKNKRGNSDRICLMLEQERYLVILADRGEYVLPWTAYPIERDRQFQKLLREYREFARMQQ